jgi:hypothetical protein
MVSLSKGGEFESSTWNKSKACSKADPGASRSDVKKVSTGQLKEKGSAIRFILGSRGITLSLAQPSKLSVAHSHEEVGLCRSPVGKAERKESVPATYL